MESPPGGELAVHIISDEAEWHGIQTDWNELFAVSATATPSLDHSFLRLWWEIFGPALLVAEPRIITVRRDGRLVGALPLYVQRASGGVIDYHLLALIGTAEPDHEGISAENANALHVPGEGAACSRAIWQAIEKMKWDRLSFHDLPENTPLLKAENAPRRIRYLARTTAPVADLTGGFEEYLQRLSSNSRQNARRLMRQGEEAGVRLEIVNTAGIDAAFDELLTLHGARWSEEGEPGVFAASPLFTEFHRRLVRLWIPDGRAVLARLLLNTDSIAMVYGFVCRQKFDYYQAGMSMDSGDALRSPGILSHLLLMQALLERGVTAYDFLQGAYSFKQRLATRQHEQVTIQTTRPNFRTPLNDAAHLAVIALRKGGRIFRSR